MGKKINNLLAICAMTLIPTLLIWLPFFLRASSFWGIPLPQNGMATIVANYDGPMYIVVAKTLYDKAQIAQNFSFALPTEYYAAHFPLFPLLIKVFSPIFGFPYSMLFVTLTSSAICIYFFHLFISDYTNEENAWWVTFLFSIFPARWLIVRSVGSPEPLFLATIIASVYYFKRKKYLLAGVWGALAQLTKSPGLLLFVAYFFIIFIPNIKSLAVASLSKISPTVTQFRKIIPILLIPLALLGVFFFYKIRVNDFLAYFHSGDNIHLSFPPFQIFNYSAPWVGTFWLEEVIFVYLFGLIGLAKLIRMKETELSWFVGIFLTSIFFVSHRDIVRYALPIVPFIFVAFAKTLRKKEYRLIVVILLIPIYLFSLGYIAQNVTPISDWRPLL
jgi:Gpi18-like mannosyltransferase